MSPKAIFDRVVHEAIEGGVTQIVSCGAGYGDRGSGLCRSGVRFFDLDFPDVSAEKADRFVADGIDTSLLTLVPVDFRSEDPAALLSNAGHDAAAPSLFIAGDLLGELERSEAAWLLFRLRNQAGAGSILSMMAEDTVLSHDDWTGLLQRAGWQTSTTGAQRAPIGSETDDVHTELITATVRDAR